MSAVHKHRYILIFFAKRPVFFISGGGGGAVTIISFYLKADLVNAFDKCMVTHQQINTIHLSRSRGYNTNTILTTSHLLLFLLNENIFFTANIRIFHRFVVSLLVFVKNRLVFTLHPNTLPTLLETITIHVRCSVKHITQIRCKVFVHCCAFSRP